MQASPRCKALIEPFEGLAEAVGGDMYRAYPDPGSPMGQGKYPKNGPDVSKGAPWTIGFGSTGKDITRGTLWTLLQCEQRFDTSIASFTAGVNRLLDRNPKAQTTQNQFDALVSFAYNCGLDENKNGIAEGLGDSTLLKKHLAGDYGSITIDAKGVATGTGAAGEFLKWNKANGIVMPGLVKRRLAEAQLYCSK